ncbi:MAG TPA: Xaa-Pro peptidase family protein [Chthonomonadaceae bacterium]|nr:Xaa-Pro peptidase family protein [Chthonomonadaceae bacterium]
MARDAERIQRLKNALQEAQWNAFACALPINVLLLTGYWPVVGTALAIVTWEGQVALLVPEDEEALARQGWADVVSTFQPGTLEAIQTVIEAARGPLAELAKEVGLEQGHIGYEAGPVSEPASYAAMFLYGGGMTALLRQACPTATPVPADDLLERLRSVKTPQELERIRVACRIAEQAYLEGTRQLQPGLKETEAAAAFRQPLSTVGVGFEGVGRADGFTFCMSGPNAARAYAAYQRSTDRILERGDFALIHCNSYADGYWTDITRTYCLGEPDERKRKMVAAVLAAREAALQALQPGVQAAEVDRAARQVMTQHGFGKEFKHPTGHGVGFAAINHNAPPRLHPKSSDVLETGMVFNVEPGLYVEGYGGLRHCDMVAVTASGMELLTPFHTELEALVLP